MITPLEISIQEGKCVLCVGKWVIPKGLIKQTASSRETKFAIIKRIWFNPLYIFQKTTEEQQEVSKLFEINIHI